MKRFLVKSYVSRLLTESQLREVQVTFLPELNPEPWLSLGLTETSSLPGRDSLPQLAVGDGEAAVPVLGGHLVLVVESHSVRGTGGGGGTFVLQYYCLFLLRAATKRNVSSAASPEVLLLQNISANCYHFER